MEELYREQILVHLQHTPEDLNHQDFERIIENKKILPAFKKTVFIFDQFQWGSVPRDGYTQIKEMWNKRVQTAFSGTEWKIYNIDLWVGIYTPAEPFIYENQTGNDFTPIADVLIRNEFSRSKNFI